MRIAQVAPLMERVPPRLYGGAERVVSALTEELVRRGHEVTLFATADSLTRSRLMPMAERGLRLARHPDPWTVHERMLETVLRMAAEFDVIHLHVGHPGYRFAAASPVPTVSTVHGRLDAADHQAKLARYPDLPLVSISRSQRAPVSHLPLNWRGTVYNGLPIQRFPVRLHPDDEPYLVFLGRINPVKGPDLAVEVARRAGIQLKVAAKIDPALDLAWARERFVPLLDGPGVSFLGEVDDERKVHLLGGARALLFPIRWEEPFGLVMAESLACGTPVVALNGGSVGEVLAQGRSGFACDSLDAMVAALDRLDEIDRANCRREAETRFSAAAMTDGYVRIYRQLCGEEIDTAA